MTADKSLNLQESAIGDLLTCPGCGGECTHAAPTANRYDSRPPEERWSWRIPMTCESGCTFELTVEQHKGSTYLRTNPPRRLPEREERAHVDEDGFWNELLG